MIAFILAAAALVPAPTATPSAQQIQQLKSLIRSITPGFVASGLCVVTYESYALAVAQMRDTGSEELWEFRNKQWRSIARVGGAFTAEQMTNQFHIPASVAQKLWNKLEASSC